MVSNMKIKEGFVVREVANQAMVIAVGKASQSFKGMIKMNQTAKDIWFLIKDGLDLEQIVHEMKQKYDIEEEVIKKDVENIIEILKQNLIVEE